MKGREVNVTLAASTAFASMWMLPRLPRLRQDLPEVDLRIQTSVRELDLEEESIPLAVRGGVAEQRAQFVRRDGRRQARERVPLRAFQPAHLDLVVLPLEQQPVAGPGRIVAEVTGHRGILGCQHRGARTTKPRPLQAPAHLPDRPFPVDFRAPSPQ